MVKIVLNIFSYLGFFWLEAKKKQNVIFLEILNKGMLFVYKNCKKNYFLNIKLNKTAKETV